MAGPKKLSPSTVRAIFRSKEPASQVAARHRVSVNLVYLIQQRKIHKSITESIRKPIRKRRSRALLAGRGLPTPRIDVNRLADRVAELVTKRVLKDLVDRLRGRR
jgi:hypothetical protein